MTRPLLSVDLSSDEFRQYYFLKEELKDFCRSEGLKVSGSKSDLEKRIIYYLDTGKSLPLHSAKKNTSKNSKKDIGLDTEIGEDFRCSEDKREFFESQIGKGFKFKVKFQKWLKSNPQKTYKDAIDAYFEIQSSKEKTKIGEQFQYNQYIRDFFKDNEDMILNDAIKCWNYKKSLKGHNKYEKSDLDILE